jgi:hypothetical protein
VQVHNFVRRHRLTSYIRLPYRTVRVNKSDRQTPNIRQTRRRGETHLFAVTSHTPDPMPTMMTDCQAVVVVVALVSWGAGSGRGSHVEKPRVKMRVRVGGSLRDFPAVRKSTQRLRGPPPRSAHPTNTTHLPGSPHPLPIDATATGPGPAPATHYDATASLLILAHERGISNSKSSCRRRPWRRCSCCRRRARCAPTAGLPRGGTGP